MKDEKVEEKEGVKVEKQGVKEKHKAKPTLGDLVFRVLVIVAIFFIALIAYASYIQG